MTDDRWLSVDEIAAHLGVKRDTIYKWLTRYRLPAHKAGRLWKFRKDEVDAWVRQGNTRGDLGTPPVHQPVAHRGQRHEGASV